MAGPDPATHGPANASIGAKKKKGVDHRVEPGDDD
jgi:hypothetical protein